MWCIITPSIYRDALVLYQFLRLRYIVQLIWMMHYYHYYYITPSDTLEAVQVFLHVHTLPNKTINPVTQDNMAS